MSNEPKKSNADLFAYYVALGRERSLGAVVEYSGLSYARVAEISSEEGWRDRVAEIEARAARRIEKEAENALVAMNRRHIEQAKLLQLKAVQALQALEIRKPADAIRALEVGWKLERLIHGEPTDRNVLELHEVIRAEYDRWLQVVDAREIEGRQQLRDKLRPPGNGTGGNGSESPKDADFEI